MSTIIDFFRFMERKEFTMGKLFGYGRVSTKDQNPELQINALKDAGYHPSDIYIKKISSRKKVRPLLNKVMELIQKGDTLVIWKIIDRIGRSVKELVTILEDLMDKGVHLRYASKCPHLVRMEAF